MLKRIGYDSTNNYEFNMKCKLNNFKGGNSTIYISASLLSWGPHKRKESALQVGLSEIADSIDEYSDFHIFRGRQP